MIKQATFAALFVSAGLLAGCNESPDAPASSPPPPTWITWVNNANGEVIKDGNNESFKVRVSDRVVVYMGNMTQLNGTFVDQGANLYVNNVLVGGVSAATSTAGTQIAVFRCNNGRALDFYNNTPTTYSWVC